MMHIVSSSTLSSPDAPLTPQSSVRSSVAVGSTPPPSATALELPPILDLSTSMRPPSPSSPNKKDELPSHCGDEQQQQTPSSPLVLQKQATPAFLEPTPQLDNHRNYESAFRPHLFSALKEKFDRRSLSPPPNHSSTTGTTSFERQYPRKWKFFAHKIPSLQIPVPRRSSSSSSSTTTSSPPLLQPKHHLHHLHQQQQQQHVTTITKDDNNQMNNNNNNNNNRDDYSPMSPTMATASAAAAASAVQHHPGSTVAESFLNCLRLSSLRNNNNTNNESNTPPPCSLSSSSSTTNDTSSSSSSDDEALLEEQDEATRMAAEALAAASADAHHRAAQEEQLVSLVMQNKQSMTPTGLDHTKFLTKNAHIKRPRNAWIHFRCHYGQALKTQDPTLRAEEISKCASRRWARLTEKEKKPWHDLAEQEKIAHKEAFPEYRYCPKRHSSSSSSSSSSSLSSPSPTTTLLYHDATTVVEAHVAEGQSGCGDTSGHRYKKARRRTK
ncbi:hypothetical protein INT45_007040 [Circinella minor]|uniref:HMG box domain-containing protein n=1 Tax=Circinella minor TaxID=1195481 RepID=A0A8H7SCM9_9FUNG|nr:hypothetical protein INT45_007040 [Circinella minor]